MRRYLVVAAAVMVMFAMALPASAHRWRGMGFGLYVHPWWDWPGGYYAPTRVVDPELTVVDTDISPERAHVYLDGELIGVADDFDGFPDYLYLEPGRYTLEFKLPGYKSDSMTIEARAGRYFPLDTELERVPGEKRRAWLDDPEGLPNRRVFGQGSKPEEVSVRRGPDPSLRKERRGEEVEMEPAARAPRVAVLELRVSPDNAAVYLDGELIGTGEELRRMARGLAVPAGTHEIQVMAPGRAPRALSVEVGAGERQQVVVELDDAAPAGGARQNDSGAL